MDAASLAETGPGAGKPDAGPGRGSTAENGRSAAGRRTPRRKTLRRAVERSLSRRVGADRSRPPADGYGAVADALVRQAVDGDLKAAKLLLEILDGGGKEEDGETVRVIVDV